jgi:predicted nuclease of restriction endonuclease-like RecB superfamily
MLTGDLLRAQLRAGRVTPRWVDPGGPGVQLLSEQLVAIFGRAVGSSLGELEADVEALAAEHPEPLLVKGMAKLLRDRTTVETAASVEPATLRFAVFEAAQAVRPVRPGGGDGFASREAVLEAVAARLGLTVAEVEAGLFADRPGALRVTACELPAADELVPRYNLALAQGLLVRAREVSVVFKQLEHKRLRALLGAIKFHRLLVRAERLDGDGLRLTLDGPMSLQQQTGRYGLQLALLLPHIARVGAFALEAELLWNKGAARGTVVRLALSEKSPILGLAAATPGVWESAEERQFKAAWEASGTAWRLEPGLALFELGGRDVLAPDYRIVHPDGREAWLELLWSWRRSNVGARLARIAEHGPSNLILAWARRGGLEGEVAELEAAGLATYGFKGVVVPERVVALAEAVGRLPEVVSAAPEAPAKAKRRPRAVKVRGDGSAAS